MKQGSQEKRRGRLLRQLALLARTVAREVERAPTNYLTSTQEKALNAVLRHLDFENSYELGDQLRKAFGFELSTVAYRKSGMAREANSQIRRKKLGVVTIWKSGRDI